MNINSVVDYVPGDGKNKPSVITAVDKDGRKTLVKLSAKADKELRELLHQQPAKESE